MIVNEIMQSTKRKVEAFSKSYPNYKAFLCDYIKKWGKQVNEKIGKMKKEEIVEKYKNLSEYIADLRNSLQPEFKYELEMMKNDDCK